jgi:alkylated DNA repair dioxygenase AlkB
MGIPPQRSPGSAGRPRTASNASSVPHQLGFFAPPGETRAVVIADDATGSIVYTPGLFDAGESAMFFERLRDEIPWNADRVWMYDREVDVPRLTAHYEPPFPALLEEIRARVEPRAGATVQRIGLNYYRDGRDSVALHNDKIAVYGEAPTIALVSFGAARRMLLRTKPNVERKRALSIDLEPGSLLLMSGSSQLHWEHGIPKENRPIGGRISVALRRASD